MKKVIAVSLLAFIATASVATAATEITGTLAASSTNSMTEFQGTLAGTAGSQDAVSTTTGGNSGGGGSFNGSSRHTENVIGSTIGSTYGTDNIIIIPETEYLTGTGGGYNPDLEIYLASIDRGESSAANPVSSEDILALNTGSAVPQFLGGTEDSAAAASSRLGTGTVALIALGTIAIVAAIGYGVNAALGMRDIDRF